MDGWGSDKLSKLTLPTTSSDTQKDFLNTSASKQQQQQNSSADEYKTFLNSKDGFDNTLKISKDESDDSLENDGKEKTDATPENLKKIDDVILTATTHCIGGDNSTNKLGETPITTKENILKKEDNSSNNTNISHNRNLNYDNETLGIRSSEKICAKNQQQGEHKIFENKNDNFELINKTGVIEEELRIIEIDDMPNENSKSISNTTTSSIDDDSPTKHETSLASSQNSFAFTIDFGGANSSNSNAEAKYKSMLERFQSRHKRGASMSKLEMTKSSSVEKETKKAAAMNTSATNINTSIPNLNKKAIYQAQPANSTSASKLAKVCAVENVSTEASKVKMRIRDKSTSGIKDPSKRHSWSPRSSAVEQDGVLVTSQKQIPKPSRLASKTNQIQHIESTHRNASILLKDTNRSSLIAPKSNYNQINTARTKEIAPRPSAMQMALEKIDFLCQQPPLDNVSRKEFQTCGSDDVSEAGTYTLDGDNYTEEQKDLMNIDKSKLNPMQQQQHVKAYDLKALTSLNRPTDLPINKKISAFNNVISHQDNIQNSRKNILEVSYQHESASDKPKISYLDKFKSRIKGKKSPEKMIENNKFSVPASSPTGDMGTFTSITTSGVLAKKSSLDPKPKLTRKSSLTTSQIDSSEYISTSLLSCSVGGNSVNSIGVNKDINSKNSQMSHSFTDHQKAEYRLNIFTNQSDSQLVLADYDSVVTPDSPKSIDLKISDTAVLKTAQSKNDWIQEWARNARARSVTSAIKPTDHHLHHRGKAVTSGSARNPLMTRSYNCEYLEESNSVFSDNCVQGLTGSAVVYSNKPIERFKSHAIGDYGTEYSSSDPNVCKRAGSSPSSNVDANFKKNSSRPPLSPSKIPSPLHSIGRTRSISKTRASLQDLSPSGVTQHQPTTDTDPYVHKTDAALSYLSRKNSIKSLNSSNQSPKRLGNIHHYSADEYSPPGHHLGDHNQNSILRDSSNGFHRRNLSFDYKAQAFNKINSKTNVANNYMSQSYSNEMNNFSDNSNDFRMPRPRKNSFDSTSYRSHQQLYGNQQIGSSSPIRQATLNKQRVIGNQRNIEQTYSIKQNQSQMNKRQMVQQQDLEKNNTSPLRRSSSFSAKPLSSSSTNLGSNRYTSIYKTVTPTSAQKYVSAIAAKTEKNFKNPLQKSASSTSFRKMYSDYDDTIEYYINDEDDLDYCSSEEFDEPYEEQSRTTSGNVASAQEPNDPPLTNTRYNKALLMRIERSKQKVAGNNCSKPAPGGVMACPNTPELPRRSVQSANIHQAQQRNSMRQSVPRDSSLNRLKDDVPNSLASAKKQILQNASKNTAAAPTQPRYLDISKYKPVQGASFLKKDESKSTLQKQQAELKRSPSNATVTLSRADPTRVSNRSVKSAGSSSNRPLSASNKSARDSSASKQKEIELEMWRRRAKYDPMRAAAEDKRKKEEAKKQFVSNSNERPSRSPNRRGEL